MPHGVDGFSLGILRRVEGKPSATPKATSFKAVTAGLVKFSREFVDTSRGRFAISQARPVSASAICRSRSALAPSPSPAVVADPKGVAMEAIKAPEPACLAFGRGG